MHQTVLVPWRLPPTDPWVIRIHVVRERQDTSLLAADAAMSRHANGDAAAFETLYDVLAPLLRAYLRRLTRDSNAAEDLLQQTLLHMHDKRGRFVQGSPVKPWAFAIARRLFIDQYRRRRELAGLELEFSDPTTPEDWKLSEESAGIATREFLCLPDAQRQAFLLVKSEGMTPAEAASVLGITSTAVRVRVHRAVATIRSALGLGTWARDLEP